MTQGKMTMKTKTMTTTTMKKWRQETKATRMTTKTTTKMTTQESRADEHEHAQKTKRRR